MLESIYEECLFEELLIQGQKPQRQVPLPVIYKDIKVKDDLKIDLLVNDTIIVELKSVIEMHPNFTAQLLTYLKLSDKPKGLLINFNVEKLVDGIIPLVYNKFVNIPDK